MISTGYKPSSFGWKPYTEELVTELSRLYPRRKSSELRKKLNKSITVLLEVREMEIKSEKVTITMLTNHLKYHRPTMKRHEIADIVEMLAGKGEKGLKEPCLVLEYAGPAKKWPYHKGKSFRFSRDAPILCTELESIFKEDNSLKKLLKNYIKLLKDAINDKMQTAFIEEYNEVVDKILEKTQKYPLEKISWRSNARQITLTNRGDMICQENIP